MSSPGLRDWLAARLAWMAAGRLRRRYPEWSDAVLGEQAHLDGEPDRLGWAAGALKASFAAPMKDLLYPAVLALAVLAMGLYQWSADERPVTVLVLSGLGLLLGFLRPSRFLVSGLAVGAVVAAVNGFETVSGVRPPYEIHSHTLGHDVRWLILMVPALVFSMLGRQAGLRLAA